MILTKMIPIEVLYFSVWKHKTTFEERRKRITIDNYNDYLANTEIAPSDGRVVLEHPNVDPNGNYAYLHCEGGTRMFDRPGGGLWHQGDFIPGHYWINDITLESGVSVQVLFLMLPGNRQFELQVSSEVEHDTGVPFTWDATDGLNVPSLTEGVYGMTITNDQMSNFNNSIVGLDRRIFPRTNYSRNGNQQEGFDE